jgi:hypothetical protein
VGTRKRIIASNAGDTSDAIHSSFGLVPPIDESDASDLWHPPPIGESGYKNLFGVYLRLIIVMRTKGYRNLFGVLRVRLEARTGTRKPSVHLNESPY